MNKISLLNQKKNLSSLEIAELPGELERNTMPVGLPNFNDPIEAARAWAEVNESAQKAPLLIGEHQAVIAQKDRYIAAYNESCRQGGELSISEFLRRNELINEDVPSFYKWLRQQGYVHSGCGAPFTKYLHLGLLTWRPTEAMDGGNFIYTLSITTRGQVWLAAKHLAYLEDLERESVS